MSLYSDQMDDDFQRPMSMFTMDTCFKQDLDLKIQDKQLNEPDIQDLEQKMQSLENKKFNFKRNLTKSKIHILNLITEQQSATQPKQPIQQQSCFSNGDFSPSNHGTMPKITVPKEQVQSTVSRFTKLNKDALSPSVPHRFTSKKRSQFSYQSNESCNSNIELRLGQQQTSHRNIQDSRKERSKIVRTTVKQYNQQYLLEQVRTRYQPPKRNSQISLLHNEGTDKSHSQSSISTPKSILKNPSSLNSSRLSFSSLQVGSQVNTHSPSKKVKFCLTKKQARRENIPC